MRLPGIVMEYYNKFMQRYEPDILFNVSGALFKQIAKNMQDKEDAKDGEDGEDHPEVVVDIPSAPPQQCC
jgi:hypothetical protein